MLFLAPQADTKHLELADAIRLAQLAEPRQLVLTHLYPEWDGIDIESKARELWSGETIAAHDGLRLEIGAVARPLGRAPVEKPGSAIQSGCPDRRRKSHGIDRPLTVQVTFRYGRCVELENDAANLRTIFLSIGSVKRNSGLNLMAQSGRDTPQK